MKKFREVLQKSLDAGIVTLPQDIIWEYEDTACVYRAVKITDDKPVISDEDFRTQAENPAITCRSDYDQHNIDNYGCSFFSDCDMLNIVLHMPRRNKKVAQGILKKEYGPIKIDNSHYMCFLFEDVHLEYVFEVI